MFPWKRYQDIVNETCASLEVSGLSTASQKIFFCLVHLKGCHPSRAGKKRRLNVPEVGRERAVFSVSKVGREWETLKVLWDFCRRAQEPWFVLYLHTKGVYRGGPLSDDWRRMMLYFCAERWQDALALFDDPGYWAAGCNLKNKRPTRRHKEHFRSHGLDIMKAPPMWHYSGNFWWARSEAICSLPDPESQEARRILTWKGIKPNLAAERWIGELGIEHLGLLHKSRVDHCTKKYPRSRYAMDG